MSCCWTSTGCALAPRTDHAVSAIYFTLAGIVLYLAADWVLERIEIRRGERLEHRTLVFFGILLGLALATFPLLQSLLE